MGKRKLFEYYLYKWGGYTSSNRDDRKQNIISVALIQTDIIYENRVPKIIFMISLIKGNLELHKQISKYLSKIMANKDMVDMLNKSQSYEEFMYKLKIYLGG